MKYFDNYNLNPYVNISNRLPESVVLCLNEINKKLSRINNTIC